MKICVDASLVVKWLTPEEHSPAALKLLENWTKDSVQLIAPSLIDFEVGTVLRQKVWRKLLQAEEIYPILSFYEQVEITRYPCPQLSEALGIAASLQQPTLYDVAYLQVAKTEKADFVTADAKFCRAAKDYYPNVKYFLD